MKPTLVVIIQPRIKKKETRMATMSDSLAAKLKMPMSGAAQGAKKSVDEELDDQFGPDDDEDSTGGSKKMKYDPKMEIGKASVAELQAALDAKQAEGGKGKKDDGDESSNEDADAEAGRENDADGDLDSSKATY